MAIDPFNRQKKWRLLYTRANKLHRARQLGFEYPRKPASQLVENASLNVLFICTMNRWRSPTAEKIYEKHDFIRPRSRGTSRKARRPVGAADIHWADVILVMEAKHAQQLRARFPAEMAHRKLHVLDIPDEYQWMDPELIQCLRSAVEPLLADS